MSLTGRRDGDRVTLDRVMLPTGIPQDLAVATGGAVEERGFKVTLPPDAFDAPGDVEVMVSPIDVSSRELQAFPGDFAAHTTGGAGVVPVTVGLLAE